MFRLARVLVQSTRRVLPVLASGALNHGPTVSRVALAGGVAAAAATTNFSLAEKAPVLPVSGNPGSNRERTLILLKPDGVERMLISQVMAKFEQKGYKLVAIKMVTPDQEMAEKNYEGLKTKPFFPGLVSYFSSGPVVAMCWEGKDAIKVGREMVDEIRKELSVHYARNIIDGSDSVDGAASELAFWFSLDDMNDYTRAVDKIAY